MTGNNPLIGIDLGLGGSRPRYNEPQRPEVVRTTQTKPEGPKFHKEDSVPGVTLENYTHRVASDDGQYVTIVTHSERIEKIKQPPTPEEIAEKKREAEQRRAEQVEQDKLVAKVVGGVCTAAIAVFGALLYFDSRANRAVEPAPKKKELK